MRVIAQRGEGNVLVALREPTNEPFDATPAVVVDMRRKRVSSPRLLQGILARGYWTPFEDDPAPVLALVRRELRHEP